MNVYLMGEWIHLILALSHKLSRPRLETQLKIHQEKLMSIKDMFLLHVVDREADGVLADADMRVLQRQTGR